VNPLLTDDAVARLPLDGGRAELLEEIVGTPAGAGDPAARDLVRISNRRRWAGPAVAAAAVAALAVGSAWVADLGHADSAPRPPAASPSPRTSDSPQPHRVVLAAAGWTLDSAYTGPRGGTGELGYSNGDATMRIDWYPASGYDARYDSRTRITDPPSDGTPVDVLGLTGHLWAHSEQDHTVLLPVEGGQFLEIRATGMDEATFVELLGRLRQVDQDGFDASLPDGFVGEGERDSRVAALLDGVERYAHPLLPASVRRADITSVQSDPVQVGSDVATQVACAWIAQYADARRRGDEADAQEAVDVMATSRQWPVLTEMQDESDVPEWVWAVSDEMQAGHVPQGWRPSCQGHLP
jgi:hypothetical protein